MIRGLSAFPIALLLLGAAPPAKVIPFRNVEGEAIVVPADSPVHFVRFDKQGVAHFSGSFTLSGSFNYGCEIECSPPLKPEQLTFWIVPDKPLAARLPHLKLRNGDIRLYVTGETRLTRTIGTAAQRASLLRGRISELHGHIAINVDDFEASIVCDSANYSARFVSVAKPAQLAKVDTSGNYGCG
jgi:hypothetical protein